MKFSFFFFLAMELLLFYFGKWNKKSAPDISLSYFMLTHNGNQAYMFPKSIFLFCLLCSLAKPLLQNLFFKLKEATKIFIKSFLIKKNKRFLIKSYPLIIFRLLYIDFYLCFIVCFVVYFIVRYWLFYSMKTEKTPASWNKPLL